MKQLVVQATIEVSGLIKIQLQNRKTLKKKPTQAAHICKPWNNVIPIWLLSLPNTKVTKL